MLIDQMRPKTLPGIKRLATRIKRAEGIPHKVALNRAARAASFENFEHARKKLTAILSIGVQLGPPIGAQKGPPWRCVDRLMLGAGFALLAA